MNIIVVDDEQFCLDNMNMILTELLPHASCTYFKKASNAVEYIKENHPIDIAFLDINMRVLNGITIAKELRQYYPKANIVFCTGYEEYSLAAWELNSSGYLLKPITQQRVADILDNLRYPIEEEENVLEFRCFGNFDVYYNGKSIVFKYSRTKEMLAYLVDRNGASVSMREIEAVLFEDENHRSYINQLRLDLINVFNKLGLQDVLIKNYGYLAIARDKVKCDYYDHLDGKTKGVVTEYMSQYSFAEMTYAMLVNN